MRVLAAIGWPTAAALIAVVSLALTLAVCHGAAKGDQQNGEPE